MPVNIDASSPCCSVSNATDNSLWADVRLAETANTNGRAIHLGNVGQWEWVMKSELSLRLQPFGDAVREKEVTVVLPRSDLDILIESYS